MTLGEEMTTNQEHLSFYSIIPQCYVTFCFMCASEMSLLTKAQLNLACHVTSRHD